VNQDLKPYLVAAVLAFAAWNIGKNSAPKPEVVPDAVTGLTLRGQFIGPTAAKDAADFSVMVDEIAHELSDDGKRPSPWYTTGLQVEELRSRVRIAMMNGESIGTRQPHVKKIVGDYLTAKLGVDPGPLVNRDAWVSALRDVAKESARAAK